MMSSSGSYGVGPMIYLLRDIELQVRSELEAIIENHYKYWFESFNPRSVPRKLSSYISGDISDDISSNISPVIEEWLNDVSRILGSNKFLVAHNSINFESQTQLELLNKFFSGGGVSKLFSLPPLPWSIDLLIKFGKLWEVAAFTVIENSLLSDKKSFCIIRDWVSEVIKKNIFQSIRLDVFYQELTNFAKDDDPSLKKKSVYKFVNSRVIPILMRSWYRKFNNKDFYERDFLEILKLNVSLLNPDYSKGESSFFVPIGSRLERGVVKFLYDLADIRLDDNLEICIDRDIDRDRYISHYDGYIENINKQVVVIKNEYGSFYRSYKNQRRREIESVFLFIKNKIKLDDVALVEEVEAVEAEGIEVEIDRVLS